MSCPDYGLAGRTGTPLIKTLAGASIIVLLSIGLEVERQEVSGFFNITFTPDNIILSDEVVVYSFLMTTRKAQRPASLPLTCLQTSSVRTLRRGQRYRLTSIRECDALGDVG